MVVLKLNPVLQLRVLPRVRQQVDIATQTISSPTLTNLVLKFAEAFVSKAAPGL